MTDEEICAAIVSFAPGTLFWHRHMNSDDEINYALWERSEDSYFVIIGTNGQLRPPDYEVYPLDDSWEDELHYRLAKVGDPGSDEDCRVRMMLALRPEAVWAMREEMFDEQ